MGKSMTAGKPKVRTYVPDNRTDFNSTAMYWNKQLKDMYFKDKQCKK